MSEIAEKTAEVVAENVEEAIDGVVDVMEVVRTNPVALVAAGVVGLTVGAAGGYFIAKKKLKAYYEDLASVEIAQAKEFYAGVHKVGEDGAVLSPMEVLEQRHPEAAASLREYRGETPAPTEEDLIAEAKEAQGGPWDDAQDEALLAKTESKVRVVEEKTETRNVFVDPTFDLEEEQKFRSPEKPYIITHDEYFGADKDYDNISLTYFEVDGVLVDEQDNPIEDVDGRINEDHLVRFGSGSKDKNIVYVRNDKLEVDFEIIKSNGSYLEEVLGLTDDERSLKHSDQRDRRREFRRGD